MVGCLDVWLESLRASHWAESLVVEKAVLTASLRGVWMASKLAADLAVE